LESGGYRSQQVFLRLWSFWDICGLVLYSNLPLREWRWWRQIDLRMLGFRLRVGLLSFLVDIGRR
jgi:hypothetical protein